MFADRARLAVGTQLFRVRLGGDREHAPRGTAEGLVTAFHVPIEDEAEYVKRKVNAPAGYELPCFLAIGYPADGAHVCVQKEIDPKIRIHTNGF